MKRYTRVGSNIDSDISRYKKALERKAAKSGLYENFGQDEIRKLREKYRELPDDTTDYRTAEHNRNSISSFEEWCDTYVGGCDKVTGATDISDEQVKFFYNGKFLGACDPDYMECDALYELLESDTDAAIAVLNYMNSLGDPVFPTEEDDYEPETDISKVDIYELYSVFMQELSYDYSDTSDEYGFYVEFSGFEIFEGKIADDADISSSTKYGADMCSIGASDEQESEDDYKYYVAGYLGDDYRGLMSDLYSDDFEEILSTAADMSAQGLFVKITNMVDGRSERYTPEDFEIAAEYGEYPDHIREDLAL